MSVRFANMQVVSYICWVPNRRGAIAVACTDPATHTERLARNGRLSNAYILVWNMRDPIHPEYVLESPHEVSSTLQVEHNGIARGQVRFRLFPTFPTFPPLFPPPTSLAYLPLPQFSHRATFPNLSPAPQLFPNLTLPCLSLLPGCISLSFISLLFFLSPPPPPPPTPDLAHAAHSHWQMSSLCPCLSTFLPFSYSFFPHLAPLASPYSPLVVHPCRRCLLRNCS